MGAVMVRNELTCNRTHLSDGQYRCFTRTIGGGNTRDSYNCGGGLIDVGTVYQAGLEIEKRTWEFGLNHFMHLG